MAKKLNGTILYDTKETAEKLGVSLPTISRMRADGRLLYTQIGHARYTTREEIAMYLKGETRERMQKISMAQKLLDNLK